MYYVTSSLRLFETTYTYACVKTIEQHKKFFSKILFLLYKAKLLTFGPAKQKEFDEESRAEKVERPKPHKDSQFKS